MESRSRRRLRVVLVWRDTVVVDRTLRPGRRVRVGEALDNLLVTPTGAGLGLRHTLVDWRGPAATLHLAPGMVATLDPQKSSPRLVSGPLEVGLDALDQAVLQVGECALLLQWVTPTRLPAPLPWMRVEPSVLASMVVALVVATSVLGLAFAIWSPEPDLEFTAHIRHASTLFTEPPEVVVSAPPSVASGAVAAAAPSGEEGRAGRKDKRGETRQPPREDPGARVQASALIKMLTDKESVLSSVFHRDDARGQALQNGLSGDGNEWVMGQGTGGAGLRGLGNGGGGFGGTQLYGMGTLPGVGPGGAGGGPRGRTPPRSKTPRVLADPTRSVDASAGCKPEDIRRTVAARQGGVSYCYEKALAADPDLGGKVTLNWRIDPEGKAVGVRVAHSTLNSREVEGCIVRAAERWTFPKPEGGQCAVTFPFVFNAPTDALRGP